MSNYPKITFATHELRRSSDGWLANGTLSAHGQTVAFVTGSRGMVGRYLDIELDAFATAV